jgi:hypothetical protein
MRIEMTQGLFEIRDPDDYSVPVTGNKDFSDVVIDAPEIVTPAQFMERYGKNPGIE